VESVQGLMLRLFLPILGSMLGIKIAYGLVQHVGDRLALKPITERTTVVLMGVAPIVLRKSTEGSL
jgi:hypothetical protein